jgi:hypothetical protein
MSSSEYGKSPYGLSLYGSISSEISISSINTTEFYVNFPVAMDISDPLLIDPLSYTVTLIMGGVPLTILRVAVINETRVIVAHTGSTFGGVYNISVVGPSDIYGVTIETGGRGETNFYAYGEAPQYTATAISGNEVLLLFSEDLIYTTDILDISNYEIETSYAVTPILNSSTFIPSNRIVLNITGMTVTSYDLYFGASKSIRYDGTYIPDISTEFNSTEYGTGLSVVYPYGLRLSKNLGVEYGWIFEDITGRITSASDTRINFDISTTSLSVSPSLTNLDLATLSFSDGTNQIDLIITMIGGERYLVLESGAFTANIRYDWTNFRASLTRNILSGMITFSINENPSVDIDTIILSEPIASFTGAASIPPGASVILSPNYSVTGFGLSGLGIESSSTIYSLSWNFAHSAYSSFVGSSVFTREGVLTENGPLVKSWGDSTLATKDDVSVRVNGIDQLVLDVNPYIGKIRVLPPIPLMPLGAVSVEVDYSWMPNPTVEIQSFNTDGAVLNKWDNPNGLIEPTLFPGLGAIDTESRFNFRAVLGPVERLQPLARSIRYFGFEKEYSSVLNDPTSLILNQNPNSISIQEFNYDLPSESIIYIGDEDPSNCSDPWELMGTNPGGVTSDGFYRIIDENSGGFPENSTAFYHKDIDLIGGYTVYSSHRVKVESYIPDGVYSGIGFGFHDHKTWYIAGLLEVNGLRHVGFMNRFPEPEKVSSWSLGPSIPIDITGYNEIRIENSRRPVSLEIGDRFQIIEGDQRGIYEISGIFIGESDTVLNISPNLPSDYSSFGSSSANAIFEIDWSEDFYTYRMVVNTETKVSVLYISGEISSSFTVGGGIELSHPSESPFLFDNNNCKVFWGSVGRNQTSSSLWESVRYGSVPNKFIESNNGVIVSTDLTIHKPDEDLNSEWFPYRDVGIIERGLSGCDISSIDGFSYSRVIPFLDPKNYTDFDFNFVSDFDSISGSNIVHINDSVKDIEFRTISYSEGPIIPNAPYRRIVDPWSYIQLNGRSSIDWDTSVINDIEIIRKDSYSYIMKTGPNGGYYYRDTGSASNGNVRSFESRILFGSYTPGSTIPFYFKIEGSDSLLNRSVTIVFGTSPYSVTLRDETGADVHSYLFDWDDGQFHKYKLLLDGDTDAVSISIDDAVQAPILSFSSFSGCIDGNKAYFGATSGLQDVEVKFDYLYYAVSRNETQPTKRTIGIYLGGDENDINSYVIPRTDASHVNNDDILALVSEYDYTTASDLRIHIDPFWGVTVFNPTIPPPPYTDIYDQTSSLISVEYQRLPQNISNFGYIRWGSDFLSRSTWNYVRYHIYLYNNGERLPTPSRMVFNNYNILSSGEMVNDKYPEVKTIYSRTNNEIHLLDCGINADNVLKVYYDGIVLNRSLWDFSRNDQIINLVNPLPSSGYPVQVTFEPGMPVTYTYLLEQDLWDGNILLNEGTPPEQYGQSGGYYNTVVPGELIESSNSDFIDNRSYMYQYDGTTDGTKFTDIDIIEVNDSGEIGLLSMMCDTQFNGNGLIEFSLGSDFSYSGGVIERESDNPYEDHFFFVIDGFSSSSGYELPYSFPYTQYDILYISGGYPVVGGVIGSNIIYPNYGASKYNPLGKNVNIWFSLVPV